MSEPRSSNDAQHARARRDFLRTASGALLLGVPVIGAACSEERGRSPLIVQRNGPPKVHRTWAEAKPTQGPQPEEAPTEAQPAESTAEQEQNQSAPDNTPKPAPEPDGSPERPFLIDDRKRDAAGQLLSAEKRTPPGQVLRSTLKQMAPAPARGDSSRSRFSLRVHGEVDSPFTLDYLDLLKLPQTELLCDIHCVTTWSVLDVAWTGVTIKELAERAGVKAGVRHVIFEAQKGYTANVRLDEALLPANLIAHKLNGESLPAGNGGPVRNVIPHLYFWKSAKWLSGIRFVKEDVPGYWEVRSYHNHADAWAEERYSSQEPWGYRENY